MNTGVLRIMWKEIAIGFIVIYILRNVIDLYIIKTYKKIIAMYGKVEQDLLKAKAKKHLNLCNYFAVGPWNKQIYLIYNGLCWILSSIALIEGNEHEFLDYLKKVRKEKEFETKSFVLSLYYRSKNNNDLAMKYYQIYLNSKNTDTNIAIIMDNIFGGKENELFYDAIRSFNNPAIKKLLKDNQIDSSYI